MGKKEPDAIQFKLFADSTPSVSEDVDEDVFEENEDEEVSSYIEEKRSYYSVSQLTRYLQDLLEEDPVVGRSVVVRGELSNVSRSSRGHVYFSMKDEGASLKGVIWAGMAKTLSFDLEDGLDVYVTGQIEIYAPSGTYSLVARKIEPVGVGALQLAFQQLKAKLETEGLFLEEFKQPLPEYPSKIGIITSGTGAVIHDMLRVIKRKNPYMDVLVAPVKVQGEGAAAEIAEAIIELNHPAYDLDLLIVGRGGGSFEDLFCFSEEPVVRAIFDSRLPVVTGIGHEPDYGLADAVADYSASTPTAAAEKVVPDYEQMVADVQGAEELLMEGILDHLLLLEQQFDQSATALMDLHKQTLSEMGHQLKTFQEIFLCEWQLYFQRLEQQVGKSAAELDVFNPLATLARGYAIASKSTGEVVVSRAQVQPGDRMQVKVSDGSIECEVLL